MWQYISKHFNNVRYSLTSRMLLLFLITASLLIALVLFTIFRGMGHHFHTQVRPLVTHYVYLISEQIGTPPDYDKAKQLTSNLPLNIHILHNGILWSTSDQLPDTKLIKSHFTPPKPPKAIDDINPQAAYTLAPPAALKRAENGLFFHLEKDDYDFYFEISRKRIDRQSLTLMLLIFSIIAASFVIVYFTACRILKPIKEIDEGVNAYAEGNFKHRIKKSYNDQLGKLVDSVNAMAEQIENMLESKRQLLLGISHELRSPIARSKVNLALMDDSKQVMAIRQDMHEMQDLIEELIEGERLNSKHAVLQISTIEMQQLIEDLLEHDFIDVSIQTNLQPCQIEADAARIKLLLRNIIQNAITHSSDNTPPSIDMQILDDTCHIAVHDKGQGIEAEHLAHLTDPFYRADPSRQRKTGGYGLGLYLCRMIAQAHHGRLHIKSTIGQGTTVYIELPRNHNGTDN